MLKPPFWVIVGVLVLVVGCGDRTPPVMSDLTFATNPSGRVPLAAVATLTTDEAAQVTVEVTDGEDTWARGVWGRSIRPPIPSSTGKWRSRCCRKPRPISLRPMRWSREIALGKLAVNIGTARGVRLL